VLLEAALGDPDVVGVKHILARRPGPNGPVVRALAQLAEAGRETVVVEPGDWSGRGTGPAAARRLHHAGAHVLNGGQAGWVHADVTIVLRREAGGVRVYWHVGSGDSGPGEQAGLLSADPDLGGDLAMLFNLLTGGGRPNHYRRLLVDPGPLRRRLLDLIAGQAGPGGHIMLMTGGVTDDEVLLALRQAAAAGAEVDLTVGGALPLPADLCHPVGGIRVRALAGPSPCHARILRFGPPEDVGARADTCWYLGSSDLCPDGSGRPLEVLVPATDPGVRRQLDRILAADRAVAGPVGATAGV
jgi:polyphosphate kinase